MNFQISDTRLDFNHLRYSSTGYYKFGPEVSSLIQGLLQINEKNKWYSYVHTPRNKPTMFKIGALIGFFFKVERRRGDDKEMEKRGRTLEGEVKLM